jgi:adenylate cyclase class 2
MDRVRSLYYNGNATLEKRGEQGRKAQMAHEIEIKLRVNDPAKLRAALKGIGARTVHRGTGRIHEWNTLFDTPGQELRKREQLLRTRIETPDGQVSWRKKNAPQPALLTFKGPVLGGRRRGRGSRVERHKVREEIEFQVSNAVAVAKILERLGMRPSFHYEKYRTTFELPATKAWATGLLIELDETPIGIFMELEGPPKAIDQAAKELGYSKKDYILTNYVSLFAEDCRRRGKKMGDMVFRNRKRWRARGVSTRKDRGTSVFS